MEIICYACGRGESPENTLIGIEHCQRVNPEWRIEMDVQMTADGHLVLHHDTNTQRTTGQSLILSKLSIKEVLKLNAAYNYENSSGEFPYRMMPVTIPLLKEVFDRFPKASLLLDIHSNDTDIVTTLIDLIAQNFSTGDFIIVSEYDHIIKRFKRLKPRWTYGVPSLEAKKMLYSSFLRMDDLFPIQSDILMLPQTYGKIHVLNNRVIQHASKRDKPIWAWEYEGETVRTVNSFKLMKAFQKLGIEGIFTDNPEQLLHEIKNS